MKEKNSEDFAQSEKCQVKTSTFNNSHNSLFSLYIQLFSYNNKYMEAHISPHYNLNGNLIQKIPIFTNEPVKMP